MKTKTIIKKFNIAELLLIETVKNTGIMEPKIYINNKGVDNNSFYVLNVIENPRKPTKKYPQLQKKTKLSYRTLMDFYNFDINSEGYIQSSLKYLSETVLQSQGSNSVYRKILVKKWLLNKEVEFFKLYSLNKPQFFKYILPNFWKFMKANQLTFFIKKLKKEKLEVSKYFYKIYKFQSMKSNHLTMLDTNDMTKEELGDYYDIVIHHNYQYLIDQGKISEYILDEENTYASKLSIISSVLDNDKMKNKKELIDRILKDNEEIEIFTHPSISKKIEVIKNQN